MDQKGSEKKRGKKDYIFDDKLWRARVGHRDNQSV